MKGTSLPVKPSPGHQTEIFLCLGRRFQLIQESADLARTGVELVEFFRLKVHEGYPLQIPMGVVNGIIAARVSKVRKHVATVIDRAGTNMLTHHHGWKKGKFEGYSI